MKKYLMIAGFIPIDNRQKIIYEFVELSDSENLQNKFDSIVDKYNSLTEYKGLMFLTAFPITDVTLEKIQFFNYYLWLENWLEGQVRKNDNQYIDDDVADGWGDVISIAIYDFILQHYPQCEDVLIQICIDREFSKMTFHPVPEAFNIGRCRLNYYIAFIDSTVDKQEGFPKAFEIAMQYMPLEENSNKELIYNWLEKQVRQTWEENTDETNEETSYVTDYDDEYWDKWLIDKKENTFQKLYLKFKSLFKN